MRLLEHWRTADGAVTAATWAVWLLGWALWFLFGLTGAALMAWAVSELAWFWNTFQWAGVFFTGLVTWFLIGVGLNLYRQEKVGGRQALDPWLIGAGVAALVLIGCIVGYALTSKNAVAGAPPASANGASSSPATSQAPSAPPVLKRPYSGEPKTTLDKDLSFISDQLNGPGLMAVSRIQNITSNISMGLTAAWGRYEPIMPILEEVGKNIDQVRLEIAQRIKQHPYQAEDLNDAVQGLENLDRFRQHLERLFRATDSLRIIFEKSSDGQIQGNAALLFSELQGPFVTDLNNFNTWIAQCNQRIDAKIRALNQ
jgi:hypothetical protein